MKINIKCATHVGTSFGEFSAQLVTGLSQLGHDVSVQSLLGNARLADTSPAFHPFIRNEWLDAIELLVAPIAMFGMDLGRLIQSGRRVALLTMWETTCIPKISVAAINQCHVLMVPSNWNRRCFTASQVVIPIHVTPLGIDMDLFQYRPPVKRDTFTFGAAGNLACGDNRKRVYDVARAFTSAFPNDPKVRLHLKMTQAREKIRFADPRIQVSHAFFTPGELADYYASLDCFVSLATAEGFGLIQLQVMSVGRLLLTPVYGGVAEFATADNCHSLPFTEVPATEFFSGNDGMWSHVALADAVTAMRCVRDKSDLVPDRGQLAAQSVRSFNLKNMTLGVQKVLQAL